MEKKVYFRPVIWLIVVSLFLSLLPIDLLTAQAETGATQEKLKTNDEQDTKSEEKLIQAPKTLEDEDRKQLEEINSETTVVKEDANQYHATFYDDQVMMETEDGMKSVDPTLMSQGEHYVPHQTNMDLAFSKNLNASIPFMKMTDQNNETRVVLKGIEYKGKVSAPKNTAAQVEDNVIWYRNISPGVDLRHVTLNNEVKEDVILKEKQPDLKSIIYEIETDKTVSLTEADEIEFKDADGEVSFKMPKPEMSDSNVDKRSGLSEKTYAVRYDLKKTGNKYILKVIPDEKWLNDKTRVYPVYIDPTFARDVTLDTFVSSAAPDTNFNKYWNSTLGQYVLRVGKYDTATGTNYTFMKFPATSYLLGANVSSAKIQSYTSWNYYGATKMAVWLDKANATWSEVGMTWNTRPTSTNITSATAATNEWLNFNVLSYAKGIAEGKSDYGVKLHTNGNGQTYWKQLSASENATNKSKMTVVYSYPKMANIQTTPYTISGTRNGYINVSWPSMLGAKTYKLQLFDGIGWQTIYTGATTSYSTKDKKIWPTTTQYTTKDEVTGGIKFRSGDGTDLPLDPSGYYTKSRGTTSTDQTFQFRVIADYALGSGAPSDADRQSIMELIPDAPSVPVLKSALTDSKDKTVVDISWPGVAGANSYNVFIYNGTEYEKIDNVTGTSWSSKGKNIFPNTTQLNALTLGSTGALRENKDGTQLPGDPSILYGKVNTKYANVKNYYFKITASSGKGESTGSPILKVYAPTYNVSANVNGYADNRKEDSGFLFASWNKVQGAAGYGVYLFNGKEYELVDILDKDTTTWHTRDKKLWPLSGKYKLNNDGIVGGGRELPLDPSDTYRTAGGDADSKYKLKVTSFRDKGTSTGKIERYFNGESDIDTAEEKEVEIQKDASPDFGDEEFYPTLDTDLGTFNTFNNNQVLSESDASLPGRGPEIDATRTFNSKTNHTGMFGLGWMSGFERRLNIEDTTVTPKVVQYTEEDGSNHLFINQDGKLLAPTGVDYEFNILNGEYIIKDEDGSQEVYGKDGLLNRIEYDAKQTGKKNAVRFIYEDADGIRQLKTILSASDPGNSTVSKNRIEFEYNDQNLVTKMTVSGTSDSNAANRIYTYQYDSFKRLTSVTGPDGTYTYSYREKYALNADGTEVSPEDVRYPGEIDIYGMPGNIDGSNQISAVYEEDVLKSVKNNEGVSTLYTITKEDNGASAEVSGEERVTEKSIFDKQGHLIEDRTESNPAKVTRFEWLDHRITKTTHPDGEVEVSDYGRRESANKTDQELDGNVVKEKDATSQTSYEYAANQDDVIATTDEFNITDEVALNADREEVADYSVQDAVIGFTQYNQFGNESRTGVSLAAGTNLLKGGGFESTNTFSGGTIIDGGIHGKALKLSGQTVRQEIPFKAGQPLNISGSFNMSAASKGDITLKFLNSSSAVISSVVMPSPKAEGRWIRKMEEEVAPTGTVKASIELSATAGTVMFDEIQVETAQAGHSTSVTPFNFVEQGGFNGTDKWTLTSGAASSSGFEGSEALQLSAGGSATQKVNIAQSTAKPIYVTALGKNANAYDTLKATVTYSDGTQSTLEQPFQTLDQNNDIWQRQTIQFSAENKPAIKSVDVILTNKDGETLFDAVRVSEGRTVEETTYDQQNNFVTQESGLSKSSVVYENDAFGNVLSVTQGSKKRSNVYDNKDNLIKTTAENGAVISYDYNQKNQVSAKHFEGQDTSYTYNKNRISSVKTADGKVTQYAYNDKTGDLSRIDLPSGKSIVYKYNREGDTTAVSDGTRNLFDYVYDADGNLTEIKDSTNSMSKRYSYENTLTNSAGDGQGRLLSITDYFGMNQSYKYVTGIDSIKTDLPSSMTFNGVESIYGYDKVNRLDKVETAGNKWLFRHDELGRINQTKLPMNTGSIEYDFGENGAIESIISETGTSNVINDQYSYDQYGNISKKQSNGVISTYQYDAMDQLTEEKIGDKTFSYSYDKRGNRTSVNGVNATFNIMNQLTQFGSESISYDADGNRTSDGKFTYEWNTLGQLTRLTEKSTGETWSYQYDEQGRRITKVHNGTTIHYHYDNDTNHLMAESQDGQVIRQYIRDQDGELLGLKVNDKYYSYHKNYRGDIIGITDMSGNLQASYEYDSWGNVLKEDVKDTNLKNQPFRYASYFYDTESSQYYLIARYYQPKHGVFLAVDPELGSGETVGMHNGYGYVNNNTLSNIDPSGRAWQSADMAGGYGSNNAGGGGVSFVRVSPRASSGVKVRGYSGRMITKTFSNVKFASKRTFRSHYSRHKKEFGNISQKKYMKKAKNMAKSKSNRILTKYKKDGSGDIVKFNRRTGEFMSITKNGILKTYFKPRYGQKNRIKKARQYFNEQ